MPTLRLNENRDARDGTGQAGANGGDMKIELSTDERRVLLCLVRDALDSRKYPLGPELKTMRDLAEKQRGEEEPKAR